MTNTAPRQIGPVLLSILSDDILFAIKVAKCARTAADLQDALQDIRDLVAEVSGRQTTAIVTDEQIKAANAVLAAANDFLSRKALPFIALETIDQIARMAAYEAAEHAIMPRMSVCGTPVQVYAYAYTNAENQSGVSTVHYNAAVYDHCRIEPAFQPTFARR